MKSLFRLQSYEEMSLRHLLKSSNFPFCRCIFLPKCRKASLLPEIRAIMINKNVMKKNQVIIRIMMVAVIMFGVETTAQAQFGGLLKKAKQAVKEKVQGDDSSSSSTDNGSYNGSAVRNARGESKAMQTNRENSALKGMEERSKKAEKEANANGGITIKHKERGIMMGTYYPNERKWVRSDGSYVIIAEDGTAKWDDGTSAGRLTAAGFTTNGIPNMKFDAEREAFTLADGTLVGTVRDEDEGTLMTYLGKDWMQTSAPVDHKTLGFLTIGMGMNVDIIKSQIKNNEEQAAAKAFYQRMMNPKRPDGRQSAMWDLKWIAGNEKGKAEKDDEWVFTNDNLKFNSVTVAWYKDNILDNFYTHEGLQKTVMGQYVNGGLKDRYGKYLGHVDTDWNVINAAGKKVGYVKNGCMYLTDGTQIGYCMGGYAKFIACVAYFMYLKL